MWCRFTLGENHYKREENPSTPSSKRGVLTDSFLPHLLRVPTTRQGRLPWTKHRACFRLGMTDSHRIKVQRRENTAEDDKGRAEDGEHPVAGTLRRRKSGRSFPGWRLHRGKKKHRGKIHGNAQGEGGKSVADTWDWPAGCGADGAPAAEAEKTSGRGLDGDLNGSRPLASTPSELGARGAARFRMLSTPPCGI